MDLTGARWRKSSYSGTNGGDCVEVAEVWRKSSHSGSNGGDCVEVAAPWQKSSHSAGNGGDCVEVAAVPPAAIAVRDSKDPAGPKLIFTPAAWTAFTQTLRTGHE